MAAEPDGGGPCVNENDLPAMVEAEIADIMGEFEDPTARDFRQMADDLERAQGPRPGPDARFWGLVIQALRQRAADRSPTTDYRQIL